ncbi:MAG: hypothetical protein J3R72DRAFT_462257 [Linnemannia gamsii]|nr:MAG: hypothetical protein J3R72DRAFT_462257 [Linnemannia gamsii]
MVALPSTSRTVLLLLPMLSSPASALATKRIFVLAHSMSNVVIGICFIWFSSVLTAALLLLPTCALP